MRRSAARSTPGRGASGALAPWAPGGGRNPRFGRPLLFPSLLGGLEPGTHDGLPALSGGDALFEGRAVVRLRSRSGRPSELKTNAPTASATPAADDRVEGVSGRGASP